jgi:hypothetical protein
MSKIAISALSGAALLALIGTASAGPMSVASSQTVTPPSQVEQARYYRYHHRHYVWHRGWHYGWYPTRYHHRHYAWYRHRYWNPVGAAAAGAVGLATLPFAAAAGWPYYYGYPYYGYRYYW